jgi:hypothetical protein
MDKGYSESSLCHFRLSSSDYIVYKYDANTSADRPPNTLTFDPKTRARSLFEDPKKFTGGTDMLQVFSTILSDARAIYAPVTPSNTAVLPTITPLPTAVSSSPAKNTPTKLSRFLRYVEEHEGMKDAPMLEDVLSERGYGPDIMDEIDKSDLVSCGFSDGDALRLKRAARIWWTSPDAKRIRRSPTPIPAVRIDERDRIRFEKRYTIDGGSVSVFGPGIVPGKNLRAKEFEWWFYNARTKAVEKIPDGFIPDIDPEYLDINAPPYEPSPSPEPTDSSN